MCGEESGDKDIFVLLRHIKVVVTRNKKTKSILIGIHGIVKKFMGLGGCNWIVSIYYLRCAMLNWIKYHLK